MPDLSPLRVSCAPQQLGFCDGWGDLCAALLHVWVLLAPLGWFHPCATLGVLCMPPCQNSSREQKSIKKPFWKHTVPSEFVVVKWSKINYWCCDKWVLWHYFYRPCKSNFLIKSADKTWQRSQAGDVSERNELTGREGCSSHSALSLGLEASLFGFGKARSGWYFVKQVLLWVLLGSPWKNLPVRVSVLARGRVGQG